MAHLRNKAKESLHDQISKDWVYTKDRLKEDGWFVVKLILLVAFLAFLKYLGQ